MKLALFVRPNLELASFNVKMSITGNFSQIKTIVSKSPKLIVRRGIRSRALPWHSPILITNCIRTNTTTDEDVTEGKSQRDFVYFV